MYNIQGLGNGLGGERLERERIVWKLFEMFLMGNVGSLDHIGRNRAGRLSMRDIQVQSQQDLVAAWG